ncbi:MAG: GAF domain-containing protein [Pseudomonadota bacterium]
MSTQDEAERARQSELDDFRIVDTLEDQAFDDLTRMAASVCGVPIALISLLDRDRQWFKSRVGLQATETPREFAFCEHAIHAAEPVMMVRDATQDERFAANPLVTGDPGIRFYAGAPLVSSGGQRLGTICVIDRVPRELDARQLETLQFLADQVMRKLEERRQALAAGGPAP